GTEVVSAAIRLSRGVTNRPKIVKFQGHYHGSHDSLVLNHATDAADLGTKDPFTAGVLDAVLEETIVLPFNDLEAVEAAFEAHGDEIAAVILEPIAHNMGCVLPEAGYLETLRTITAENGSFLIFDEIVSGFRHDPGGAQAIFDVTPDLATFGKSVANGYPLSVLCGAAEYMERFQTTEGGDVAYGGTYNAHAGSLAAARETIHALEDREFYRVGAAMSEELADALSDIIDDAGLDAQVRQFGTVFLTYFTTDPIRRWEDVLAHDTERYQQYRRQMFERGILMGGHQIRAVAIRCRKVLWWTGCVNLPMWGELRRRPRWSPRHPQPYGSR
ncbi:MAG: aminotransferase class III-fold pyridoxal phosphate-dependent enzyme, partial [Halobacteriales archaeon]|nr:aminotransferase class III-fold pyridoxal phosphate-dependent enzyme [Halobacteriales archaeon]